jgi:UDPglucose--hexose-1-phosphate uridylyltransferase
MSFDPTEHPHRRRNPLTGESILVSPHRMKRPWLGKQERPPSEDRPAYDPTCYLCPGNTRAGGVVNPTYDSIFVFTNDFAALLPDVPQSAAAPLPLMLTEPVQGTCRVICFSPRHDLTLPEMTQLAISQVVNVWVEQTLELGQQYRWVQVFENKGELMGASNLHPHGQIWAGDWLPDAPRKEDEHQRAYYAKHNSVLLLDYAAQELGLNQRIVVENEHWLAVVPYWATWPFETLLLPRRHILRLPDTADAERDSLADLLKRLLTRYDNLFEISFPYSMGWHGAPFTSGDYSHWQLHAHFYPPLLRSATVKKFMVGYEMMAEPQRDLTPEQGADRLRSLSDVHYKSHEK